MKEEKQRIAEWRAKRRQQRLERDLEQKKTRKFGGHFFLNDDEEESIDPADAAADAEEQTLAKKKRSAPAEVPPRLSSSEVRLALWSWDMDALRQLWSEREKKLTYIEDAARLLAHIRHRTGIDASLRSPAQMMGNDAIEALKGSLEESGRLNTASPISPSSPETVADGKRVEQVLRVIREGQADFRKRLMEHYGAVCMVTGTTHASVIDAAHIKPYNGVSTNALGNGLLLRKDIHALFDAGLLDISPDLLVSVSDAITDPSYRVLHGKRLILRVPSRISPEALLARMRGEVMNEIAGTSAVPADIDGHQF